jgi:hypothetical protein
MNTKLNDGGPAFPIPQDSQAATWSGMSLRDYFAAKALRCVHEGYMQSAVKDDAELEYSNEYGKPHTDAELMALDAYALADAMLAAREVQP